MDITSAIVLGVVQGLTEFLPVSSTGHLILTGDLLGLGASNSLAFDAMLHLATAAAVIVYYFQELWLLLQTLLRKLGRLPVNEKDMTLIYALIVGTIPGAAAGALLEKFMDTTFRAPLIVAGILIVGSVFFVFAEYRYQNCFHEHEVDVMKGLKIGLFQCLALLPGFSRSGATIGGGMFLGLSRSDATRFAFLMSIPIILGAGSKKFIELITSHTAVDWTPILVGAATAFIVGLAAIHFMVTFIREHSLWPFVWYRIILAGFVIFIVFFG